MTYLRTSLSTKEIQDSFSRAAKHYDELSAFHQKYALRMVEEIMYSRANVSNVLDVGCGTGYLSALLKSKYPTSNVSALDFSAGMIEMAKAKYPQINFMLADANQIPVADASYDLLVSNFAYQWVNDLTRAFVESRRVLTSQGQLTATLFGYQSCAELFDSLEAEGFNCDVLNRFVTVANVQDALEAAGLRQFNVQHEINKLAFDNLWQLLGWLKAIGANKLSEKKFIGPKLIQRANEYCLKHYAYQGKILISFEIIKIQAIN